MQTSVGDRNRSDKTYRRVIDICASIGVISVVRYMVSGLIKWLQTHECSYKPPQNFSAKVGLAKQEEFIKKYLSLVSDTPVFAQILFMHSAHPTLATKGFSGWIKKAVDKL